MSKQQKQRKDSTKSISEKVDWLDRYGWVLLIIVPFAVYAVTLGYKITQLDDYIFIFDKDVFNQKFSNITKIFSRGVFSEKDIYYRPLFLATFIIERLFTKFEGSDALRLYHLTNIVIHIGCTILLWQFLKRLGTNAKTALILSLLFALHPTLTMAVAWIPGRNDTLLTLFALLFFIQLHKYINANKWKHLVLQALFFAAALFTKETAVFIPFAAMLFLWTFNQKLFEKKSLLLYATWLPLGLLWFVLRQNILDRSQDTRNIGTIVTDAFSRLQAYLVYVGKIVFPFNLSVFPSLDNETIWYGLVAIVLIAFVTWLTLKKSEVRGQKSDNTSIQNELLRTKDYGLRTLALGLGWFFIFITPFLLVPKNVNDQVFEHRLYLPMIGFMIFLSHTILFNGTWKFNRVATGSGLVGILFVILIYNYLPLFNDPIKFWEQAIISSPNSSYAHKLLGARYNEADMKFKALEQFKIAYSLNKEEKHARYFIVRDELEPAGKIDSAMKLLYEEIKINPTYTESYFELSHLYFLRKQMDSTVKYLLISSERQPNDQMINNNLLLTYIGMNDYTKAKNQVARMEQNGLVVDATTKLEVENIPH